MYDSIGNPTNKYRNLTKEDSVRIITLHNNFKNKKQIIAIDSLQLKPIFNKNIKLESKCEEFRGLFEKFLLLKDKKKKTDLDKINLKRNDSLIYFSDSLLDKHSRDYFNFDIRLTFSNIVFNKNHNEAIIQVSKSTSKLAGVSIIFFFKKKNEKWEIECEHGISIW